MPPLRDGPEVVEQRRVSLKNEHLHEPGKVEGKRSMISQRNGTSTCADEKHFCVCVGVCVCVCVWS